MNDKKLYTLSNAQKLLKWSEIFSFEPRKVKENNVLNFYAKTPYHPELSAEKIGDILEGALNEVLKNNDSLRLRIIWTIKGVRQYVNDFEPMAVDRISVDGEKAFEEILPHIDQYQVHWFDERLFAAKIFVLSEHQCVLLLRFHHSIFDGYSVKLFFDQFINAYQSLIAGKIPEPDQVKRCSITHYFEESKKYFQSPQHREDRKYWFEKFWHQRHYQMPAGRRHPLGDCDQLFLDFKGEDYKNLTDLAQKYGCSFQSLLMTLAAVTTYLITGKDNFCFFSLTHGRRQYAFRNSIGCMMNTVPVFFDFNNPELSVGDIITDCYADYIEALKHSQFPMNEQIPLSYKESVKNFFNFNHGWLLFSTMDYQSVKTQSELEIVDLPALDQPHQFYLSVLDTHQGSVTLVLSYQTHKFKAEKIREILNTYDTVCKTVSKNAEISLRELVDTFGRKISR